LPQGFSIFHELGLVQILTLRQRSLQATMD